MPPGKLELRHSENSVFRSSFWLTRSTTKIKRSWIFINWEHWRHPEESHKQQRPALLTLCSFFFSCVSLCHILFGIVLISCFDIPFWQVQYSWLWKLANVTQSPYSYVWMNDTNTPEIINGPSKKTMYVTALYFTMTCMTVGSPFQLSNTHTHKQSHFQIQMNTKSFTFLVDVVAFVLQREIVSQFAYH